MLTFVLGQNTWKRSMIGNGEENRVPKRSTGPGLALSPSLAFSLEVASHHIFVQKEVLPGYRVPPLSLQPVLETALIIVRFPSYQERKHFPRPEKEVWRHQCSVLVTFLISVTKYLRKIT